MTSPDVRGQGCPDGAEDKAWLARPRIPAANPTRLPYWTLDTTTEEWVQRQRDGTEICRAPTRHKQVDA